MLLYANKEKYILSAFKTPSLFSLSRVVRSGKRVWSQIFHTRDVHVFGEDEQVQRLHLHVYVVLVTANHRVR